MSKIYVVVGSRGEYSDFNQWNVRAFMDEGDAGTFKVQCELEDKRIGGVEADLRACRRAGEALEKPRAWDAEMVNKFDPGFVAGHSYPTEYSVEELEMGFPQ